jgi:hypothetical protein
MLLSPFRQTSNNKPPTTWFCRAILPLAAILLVTGCASPWETSFHANPGLASQKFAPTRAVQVRTVEAERLKNFAEAERQRRVNSSTAPVDLPAAEKLAAKNRLLEALQIPERGDEAQIIGTSRFTSPEVLSADDPHLISFARKLGADAVVVSTAYLGKTDRIDSFPVTSTSSDTYVTHYRRSGNRVTPVYSSVNNTSTTWVPVPVTEDQYGYQAFYLRRRGQ